AADSASPSGQAHVASGGVPSVGRRDGPLGGQAAADADESPCNAVWLHKRTLSWLRMSRRRVARWRPTCCNSCGMKLIVQPDAGIAPILTAIKQGKRTVDMLIFRLDRPEIARALQMAVLRGVRVRALTAHQNRGGTKSLRKLEMELLEAGVTVSRTADDLVRYHAKFLIVDGKFLHVYGFNFTALDIMKSRSFGVVTRNKKLVCEAQRLFDADFDRRPYACACERFVVSPDNARERLAKFLRGARKQLLIYDPKVSDDGMLKILTEKIGA